MSVVNIVPVDRPGGHRTGSLSDSLSKADIIEKLGFSPNCNDDPDKVRNSWGFLVNPDSNGNGTHCGIWDYKGFKWSTYGPDEIFEYLFGDNYKRG
jgi:hypothetical protein